MNSIFFVSTYTQFNQLKVPYLFATKYLPKNLRGSFHFRSILVYDLRFIFNLKSGNFKFSLLRYRYKK